MAMLAGPRGEMMWVALLGCRMGGTQVSSSGGMKCGLSCWDGRVAVVAAGRTDQKTRWGEVIGLLCT